MSQQLCRDYLNGYCRFGDRCRFYHPLRTGNNQPQQGNRSISGSNSTPLGNRGILKYQFTEATLLTEFREDRPRWAPSAFGPAKYEPNLFFDCDTSQEEMRWRSVMALKAGNPQVYAQDELKTFSEAQDRLTSATDNIRQTREIAEKLHDARFPGDAQPGSQRPLAFSEAGVLAGVSQVGQTGNGGLSSSQGGGGAFGQSAGGAFGGGGSAGGRSGPFRQSSGGGFVQGGISNDGGGAFGKSAFGQTSKPIAFGGSGFAASTLPAKPVGLGAASSGTFGQSGFGQTSSGAAAAFGTSDFGSSSNDTKAVAFGSTPTASAAFGASSFPAAPAAFGSTATPSTGSVFGSSGFGNPAVSTFEAGSSVIPAAFRSSLTAAPAFGSTQTVGASGTANGLAGQVQPSTIGSTSAPSASRSSSSPAAFGATTAPAFGSSGSAFGQSGFGQAASGKPAQSSTFGGFLQVAPPAGQAPAFGATSTPSRGRPGFGGVSQTSAGGAFGSTTSVSPGTFGAFSNTDAIFQHPSAFGSASGARSAPQSDHSAAQRSSQVTPNPFSLTTSGGQSVFSSNQSPPPPPPCPAPAVSSNASTVAPTFNSQVPAHIAQNTYPNIPSFDAIVDVPAGWSWEDTWSWLMPTIEGNGPGGRLDEEMVEAFKGVRFALAEVPILPPPVNLRA